MATPLSADRLLKALRNEGLRVVEHRSWRTHNRNHKGPWGPVNGVMIHHTVTKGTESSVELCYNGHSSLPGPLCHGVIAKDGTVYLVGNGRANHAGLGDDDVLRAVVNESAPLPADNEANTDGNRHFYGFECINLGDGKDPWPAAQLEAVEKAAAAICRAHGWSHRSVIGHKEWQPGKVDPRGFTMDSMRSRIKERLGGGPDGPATPPPAPQYEPFPGAAFFQTGRRSPIITAMGRRLVAEGCGRYEVGPGPEWTEADRASYAAWQRKLGYSGSDADGIPGRTSWDKLKVPNV
ncbi:peptidoglycan-binding protein [Streptomyces sp. NPDC002867]